MVEDRLEQIVIRLSAGVATTAELERQVAASKSWVTGCLKALIREGRVVRLGTTRGARYGLKRGIPSVGSAWPLYRVRPDGAVETLGMLNALATEQYYFETAPGTAAGFSAGGLYSGLPYFLQDQRPGGFLGRLVPNRHPDLDVPPRVGDWSDDHYLRYLVTHGSDAVGDLILGEQALGEYIARQREPSAIEPAEREQLYPRYVSQVMQGGFPGSSAHGEQPKFTAMLANAGGATAVLVKFSPPANEAAGRRWADLLIAEHHAAEALRHAGVPAVASRVFRFGDRTYLETDRFDRAGAIGRVGVTSLLAIDSARYGRLDDWIAAVSRLCRDARIDAATLECVRLAFAFGGLIGNTDRHFGNLAFYDRYDGRFELAPIYDMLPMLFAPEHGQIIARVLRPPDPVAGTLSVWAAARALAEKYWRELRLDARVSEEFRELCAACLSALEALPRTGAYAPRAG